MTINCNGSLIDLHSPKVMGILNLTPDSFYDGGRLKTDQHILNQVEKMLVDGATFVDIGGYSSRPGADHITSTEEEKRVVPSLELVLKHFPQTMVSIDTFRSSIAAQCLNSGAALINDISGGHMDTEMLQVVARYQAPYIAMHMKGTPQTMKTKTDYRDILKEIQFYFSEINQMARELQLNDLIFDVGFGFSKTAEQSFFLLKNLSLFQSQKRPILAGVSRKSMIYKTLSTTPENALNGTTALNTCALLNGANILRVHDVKEAIECIALVNALKAADC